MGSHSPEKITLIDSRPMKREPFIGIRASEKKRRKEKQKKKKRNRKPSLRLGQN